MADCGRLRPGDAPGTARRRSGGRLGSALRTARHRRSRSAGRNGDRLRAAQRHRPAPGHRRALRKLSPDQVRGSRGEVRTRSPRPDHRFGRGSDSRVGRCGEGDAHERAGRAAVHGRARWRRSGPAPPARQRRALFIVHLRPAVGRERNPPPRRNIAD